MASSLEVAAQSKVKEAGAEIMSSLAGARAGAVKTDKLAALRASLNKVVNISPGDLELHDNVRKEIDQESFEFTQLVQSVKKFGVLTSAVAELREDGEGGYQLVCVAGHRRILAAIRAGNIERIPCLIKSYDDRGDRIGAALSENMNREDLHCLDIAEAFDDLVKAGWNDELIAQQFERNPKTIKHYLKIARWPQAAKDLIREHRGLFSTRIVMQKLAYQKFASGKELITAIKALIDSHEQGKTSKAGNERRVEIAKKRLSFFFSERPALSKESKQLVLEALQHFKVMPTDVKLTGLSARKTTEVET